MPLVHRLDLPASSEAAHRDAAVGSAANRECAHVCGVKAYVKGFAGGELGVPESRSCSGQLTRYGQR